MKHYYFYLVTFRISNLRKEKKYVRCELRVAEKVRTFAQAEDILQAVKSKLIKEYGEDYKDADISFAHPPYSLRTEELAEGLPDPEITELKF